MKKIKIASGQGFYGDSNRSAVQVAKNKAADYIVFDALAELTLSILQKDKMRDETLGYARDIEANVRKLYPIALQNGIKLVTNSGGLNPKSAAKKLSAALAKQGLDGVKIATVEGDNYINRLDELQSNGEELKHLDTNQPFATNENDVTHANLYIGAQGVVDALKQGADIVLAGRVADPCLTLGILAYEFGWDLNDESQENLNKLAQGITVGHLLECGGQASGGNSYAEWPMEYQLSNLGYPIAEVDENGVALFSKLEQDGGKLTRNTLREQLVYEIHNPNEYLTPDVTVDFTQTTIEEIAPNQVKVEGSIGKRKPQKLKLTMGLNEGFISEQFFFMSWPYTYTKAKKFVKAVEEIWSKLPLEMDEWRYTFTGINGIHETAAPLQSEEELNELNEIGVRLAIRHKDPKVGKIALGSVIPLGLNGPPGLISIPGWGKINRQILGLWPTLIDRKWFKEEVNIYEVKATEKAH